MLFVFLRARFSFSPWHTLSMLHFKELLKIIFQHILRPASPARLCVFDKGGVWDAKSK